jgi:hypothetical protein
VPSCLSIDESLHFRFAQNWVFVVAVCKRNLRGLNCRYFMDRFAICLAPLFSIEIDAIKRISERTLIKTIKDNENEEGSQQFNIPEELG